MILRKFGFVYFVGVDFFFLSIFLGLFIIIIFIVFKLIYVCFFYLEFGFLVLYFNVNSYI